MKGLSVKPMKNTSSNTASTLYCDPFKLILKHHEVQLFGTIVRDVQILCPLGLHWCASALDVQEKVSRCLPLSAGRAHSSFLVKQHHRSPQTSSTFLNLPWKFPHSFQIVRHSEEKYRNIRCNFPKAQLKEPEWPTSGCMQPTDMYYQYIANILGANLT